MAVVIMTVAASAWAIKRFGWVEAAFSLPGTVYDTLVWLDWWVFFFAALGVVVIAEWENIQRFAGDSFRVTGFRAESFEFGAGVSREKVLLEIERTRPGTAKDCYVRLLEIHLYDDNEQSVYRGSTFGIEEDRYLRWDAREPASDDAIYLTVHRGGPARLLRVGSIGNDAEFYFSRSHESDFRITGLVRLVMFMASEDSPSNHANLDIAIRIRDSKVRVDHWKDIQSQYTSYRRKESLLDT